MKHENKILDLADYWQRDLESEPAPGALWRLEAGSWHLYREPMHPPPLHVSPAKLRQLWGRFTRAALAIEASELRQLASPFG